MYLSYSNYRNICYADPFRTEILLPCSQKLYTLSIAFKTQNFRSYGLLKAVDLSNVTRSTTFFPVFGPPTIHNNLTSGNRWSF